jgi:hypothetical protein
MPFEQALSACIVQQRLYVKAPAFALLVDDLFLVAPWAGKDFNLFKFQTLPD